MARPGNTSSEAISGSKTSTNVFQNGENLTVHFEFWLFFVLIIENWLFDFGRPIANFYVRALGPDAPGLGDWFHIAYNIITPFLLITLMDKANSLCVPKSIKYLLIIFFTLGASIHLVGDSIQAKLVQNCDYALHLSVRDNPVMKNLSNQEMIHIFELIYAYDEHLGHYMWYVPYFAAFLIFFHSATLPKGLAGSGLPSLGWALLVPGGTYYWYLIVEGQVWPLFLTTYVLMLCSMYFATYRGESLDVNGRFLFGMFSLTCCLFLAWLLFCRTPIKYVYTCDLDGVPEFWETFPRLYHILNGKMDFVFSEFLDGTVFKPIIS